MLKNLYLRKLIYYKKDMFFRELCDIKYIGFFVNFVTCDIRTIRNFSDF